MAGTNRCYGCGRSITANQKGILKYGEMFHENCLDLFLESNKGQEWEHKYWCSEKGQREEIDNFITSVRQSGLDKSEMDANQIREDLLSLVSDNPDKYQAFRNKLSDCKQKFKFQTDLHKKKREIDKKKKEIDMFITNILSYTDVYQDIPEYDQIKLEITSAIANGTDEEYVAFHERMNEYENKWNLFIEKTEFVEQQINGITLLIDTMKQNQMYSGDKEYEQIKNDLLSLVAEYGDNEKYNKFVLKREEYEKQLQDFIRQKNEHLNHYDKVFEDAYNKIDDAFLFLDDDEEAKKTLNAIKDKKTEENEAILQEINSLKLKEGSEANNGLILFGIMFIVNVVFAPIGIILLIIGIIRKHKPDKDAEYNYNLIKEILNTVKSN